MRKLILTTFSLLVMNTFAGPGGGGGGTRIPTIGKTLVSLDQYLNTSEIQNTFDIISTSNKVPVISKDKVIDLTTREGIIIDAKDANLEWKTKFDNAFKKKFKDVQLEDGTIIKLDE